MMQFGFLFRHAGKAEVSTHDALLGRWRRPVGRVEVLWLLERRHGCGCAQTPFDATREKEKEKVESQHRQDQTQALLEMLREISTRHERGQPCQDHAHPDADGSGPLVSAGRARRPPKIQNLALQHTKQEHGEKAEPALNARMATQEQNPSAATALPGAGLADRPAQLSVTHHHSPHAQHHLLRIKACCKARFRQHI